MSWWCFLIFLLSLFQTGFLSSPSPSPSPQLCLHDERSALLQLKQKHFLALLYYNNDLRNSMLADPESCSVTLYNSDPLKSWKPHTDCCYWQGITCDGTTGHVVGLHLRGMSLYGSVDSNSSLFNLHHLQMLDLSYNCLSGQIPSQISQLTNLVSLNLSGNSFGGQIPSEISQLTKLVSLDLSFNGYYQLQIPQLEISNLRAFVQDLSSLRDLHLDGVNLSSQKNMDWCHHLSSSLPKLQVLSMSHCSLPGPLDASISNLCFLSVLHLLSNPNISSTVPSSLINLTSLSHLNLRDCGLLGDFPSDIFLQPSLKTIDLYSNPLLSVHLPEFPQVNSTLEVLGVGRTKFQGKLPNSVGNLKFLQYLCVWGLNLSGLIPPSLANLTHLTWLDLSVNNFIGETPSSFRGRFPNLENLFLHNNLLQGPINSYLFFLPSLLTLSLSNNKFSGVTNEPIHNISIFFSPLEFYLSGNYLKGQDLMKSISKIKGTFSFLDLSLNDFSYIAEDTHLSYDSLFINRSDDNFFNAQIQELDMTGCNVGRIPDFLRNHKELSVLYLSDNRISKFPDFLRDLKALNSLDISSNRIAGAIPKWIWQINLVELNLSNNFFTGLELPLPNQSNIMSLDLHSNMIQECLPTAPCFLQTFNNHSNSGFVSPILGNLTTILSKVNFFSISNNKLTGKIPFSICNSSGLDILDLSNNQLSGTIPPCFGSSNLGVLNLEGNKFHGPIPPTFKNGCNLHTLRLNKNMLLGKVPRSLGNCKQLKLLNIADNQLNDTFPYWLENLSELQVLVLRSNKFGGPIAQLPQVDSPFPSLHVIDLSFNNFIGNLPLQYICHWKAMVFDKDASELKYNSELKSIYFHQSIGFYQDTLATMEKGQYLEMPKILSIFNSIDLSNNNFKGKIPDALGNLKALKVLNLSRNSLTGQIPFSLGNLSELESLDLSRNELFGEIPKQLISLTFLSVLNLSYNNFTGNIPLGNQFNTFSNASYEGNVGLCGFPLSRKCGVALPPKSTFQQKDEATSSLDWIFALAGYCSGLIVGLVIGQQLFWRKGRCSEFISRVMVSKQKKGLRKIKNHKRGK